MKKVLLVGFGSIGRRHLKNTRELLPGADIMVYRQYTKNKSDPPEGANSIVYSLEEAIAFRPNAVIISSPAHEHISNALVFLREGAHLFIEKPLSINLMSCNELITAIREKSVFAMVGYVLRFQPIVKFLEKIIREEKIGIVHKAFVEVGQYLPDWRPSSDYRKSVSAQESLGGGVLLELSHEIDYATWFFGFPDEIYCSSERLSGLEIDVEDSATVVMNYRASDKKRVIVNLDFLQRAANMSVRVIGSEGTLQADLIKETATITKKSGEILDLNPPRLTMGNEMYLRQFDFFFSKVFSDYSVRFEESRDCDQYVSIERAAKILELIDISKKSNREGKRLSYAGGRG